MRHLLIIIFSLFLGLGVSHSKNSETTLSQGKSDDAYTQLLLGVQYYRGDGVEQDYKKAFELFHKSAEQGATMAQFILGNMYRNGEGVDQDHKKAFKWHRKAAEHGYISAQYNLGDMYYNGDGVEQDYKQAIEWFRKAAEQGNALAQLNLGTMYYFGQGIPQDYISAHMWLNLAASASNSDALEDRDKTAKIRDDLANLMTSTQVAEAQRRASECVVKEYKDC